MMSLIEEEESARVYFFGKEGDDVEEEAVEQIVSDCPPPLLEIEGKSLISIGLRDISIHFV